MRASDAARLALESLRLHRLRTLLTLMAVAVGVTAVLLLTALGEAAKSYVVGQFAALGSNLIQVTPGRVETAGMPATGGATRDLTVEDAEAIRRRCPAVADAAPMSLGTASFEHGPYHRDVYVAGVNARYFVIRNVKIARGRGLPATGTRRGEQLVVIGPKLAREVFRGDSPLGQSVRIAQVRFRVIGVLAPRGQSFGLDFDEMALVPVGAGLRLFDQSGLARIVVQARDAKRIPAAVVQTREVLRRRHDGDEDFTLITQDAMMRSFRSVIDAITAALAGIAAISLAVAGIGIMNVMLVSVSERTAEVGLFKALGARRAQISRLFALEALFLSAAGAALGLAAGFAITAAIGRIWPVLSLRVGWGWVVMVTALALGAGVVFGWMPARRAARLSATAALGRGR